MKSHEEDLFFFHLWPHEWILHVFSVPMKKMTANQSIEHPLPEWLWVQPDYFLATTQHSTSVYVKLLPGS